MNFFKIKKKTINKLIRNGVLVKLIYFCLFKCKSYLIEYYKVLSFCEFYERLNYHKFKSIDNDILFYHHLIY